MIISMMNEHFEYEMYFRHLNHPLVKEPVLILNLILPYIPQMYTDVEFICLIAQIIKG